MPTCPFVPPAALMEQPGTHYSDFHEIWRLSIFQKPVENIQ
jgi:hypothetical protein